MDSYVVGPTFYAPDGPGRRFFDVTLSGRVGKPRKEKVWRTTVRIFAEISGTRGGGTSPVAFLGKDGTVIAEFTGVECYRLGVFYPDAGMREET
jgi:hypothetical protein